MTSKSRSLCRYCGQKPAVEADLWCEGCLRDYGLMRNARIRVLDETAAGGDQ